MSLAAFLMTLASVALLIAAGFAPERVPWGLRYLVLVLGAAGLLLVGVMRGAGWE